MGIRILLIEDDPGIAAFLVRGLREEGFVIEHAVDASEAWHRLHSETWDVVPLDWWLPGEDGLNLLRRFRQANGETSIWPGG